MISLEKKLLMSVLSDLSKDVKSIGPADIEAFFVKSKDKLRRLLHEKELYMRIARSDLDNLEKRERETDVNAPDDRVSQKLRDLHNRLEIATLEFNHRKETKYNNLIRKLKMALASDDKDDIYVCLYNIDQLKQNIKNIEMCELQEEVAKCIEGTAEADQQYFSLYTVHEERTRLLENIDQIQSEIQSLKLLLELE